MEDLKCRDHADEQLRMFCKLCEQPICVQCLLDNHQQHKVQALTDASKHMMSKLQEWCADNKEETIETLFANKSVLEDSMAKLDQDETTNLSTLENCAMLWKNKIEDDLTCLSSSVKKYFNERKTKVITSIVEIDLTLDGLKQFNAENKVLPLYARLKPLMESNSFSTEDKNESPALKLNEPPKGFSIGSFLSDDDQKNEITTRSVGLQTEGQLFLDTDESNICETKGLICKLSLSEIGRPVSKILALSETDALLVSGRKLFRLDISSLKRATYTDDLDDIVNIRTQEFLILNQERSLILHWSTPDIVTPFTSTDPYMPVCMGYAKSDNSVLVWMTNRDSKVMTLFDSYGVKKRSFSLAAVKSMDAFMSVFTSNNFVIVYEVEQSTGRRNHVYAYSMEPKTSYSFSGKFGQSPYLQFICKGLCYDDTGNVLCCDTQFNAVYKLNSKLEYQSVLLEKLTGLVSPSALAFKDGLLWVADNNCLRKYKYENLF